ncbi:MAG TPA: hypothetical protein VM307_12825 [Egibacteraceae bacterium]|nr:hypothetical protein [Egibacteraceae bacterium]
MTGPYRLAVDATAAAADRGVALRLFGGQAVRHATSEFPPRAYSEQDIDFACTSRQAREVVAVLTDLGYVGDERFNALYGHRQMYFQAPDGTTSVDVVVDRLTMCHELHFADRIDRLPVTLDITDLLLSKLQVVKINEKDVHDAVYLLAAHAVAEGDEPGTIGLDRWGEVLGSDWGWWRTVTGNLRALLDQGTLQSHVPANAEHDPFVGSKRLLQHAEDVPKTRRWKLRARVGDRVRWYEEPEEVQR